MLTRPKLLINLEKINTAATVGMGVPTGTANTNAPTTAGEVGVDPVQPPPVGTTQGLTPPLHDDEGDAPPSDNHHSNLSPPARQQSRGSHRQGLPPPPSRTAGGAGDGSAAAAGAGNRSQAGAAMMPPTTPGSMDTSSVGGLSMSLPDSPSEQPGQGLGQGFGQGLEGDSHFGTVSASGGMREDGSVMVSVGREESHAGGQGLGRQGLEGPELGGGDDSRDEARSISNSTISSHGITPAVPVPSHGGSLTRTSRNVYDGSISSATLPSVDPPISTHPLDTLYL